jgi:tetratricopeptide (TPR) repeat protein
MNQDGLLWYLPDKDQQPAGPFSTDDVLARYRTGAITGATFCWRDGMDSWKPLAEVQPFQEALAQPVTQGAEVIWYIVDENNQPAGPLAAATILARLQSRQCDRTTLCWREGMPDWQPLGHVEPFAGMMTQMKAEGRKHAWRIPLRIGVAVVIIACLAAAGTTAYFVIMGPAERRQGQKLISAGRYQEALRILAPYVKRKPLDNKAQYLLAIAQVNEYATADTGAGFGMSFVRTDVSLNGVKKNLGQVFAVEPGWREKARDDLAAASARIPPGAFDAATRALGIARLRSELGLTDKVELAAELLALVAPPGINADRTILQDREVALQIYDWDTSLGKRIVELAIAAGSSSKQEFWTVQTTLDQWVRQRPALAVEVALQLVRKAESLYNAGRSSEAKAMLLKGLAIDPKVAKTQEQVLLCIRLTDPDDAKLARCEYFLKQWPQSPYLADVLTVIIRDAVTVSDRYVRYLPSSALSPPENAGNDLMLQELGRVYGGYGQSQRVKAAPYLAKGLQAAKMLLQKFPKRERLDVDVYELAKRLANSRQFGDAITLASELNRAIPDSPLKGQIQASIKHWEGSLPNREREELLNTVEDAIASFDRSRTWDDPAHQQRMKDSLSAASTLLEKWPRTTGLDSRVYELTKRLAEGRQYAGALDLAMRLLEAIPHSTLRRQIETSIAQWEKDFQPPIVRIADADELSRVLDGGVNGNIMWVAMTKATVGEDNIRKLQDWTRAGGVLWLETDVAESFGFGNVIRVPAQELRGNAAVVRLPHPIVQGLQGRLIGYEVAPGGGEIYGTEQAILNKAANLTPLLVRLEQVRRGRRISMNVHILCGILTYDKGVVVLRPAKINTETPEGRRFEENLRSFGPADQ